MLLRELARARSLPVRGWSLPSLAYQLRLDPLQIEPVLDTLIALDWVGRLDEGGDPRHVLACDPATTPVAPLVDALLLAPSSATAAFRDRAGLARLTLADVLG